MANTVNRNYPLTGVNDAPDGPLAIQRLAEAVDTDVEALENELRTVQPFGHMGASNGFQAVSGAGTIVAMSAAQELAGGMTFDNAADSLVVPKAGLYRITCRGYLSGSAGYIATIKAQKNLTDIAGTYGASWKADSSDYIVVTTVTRRLAAGDKINLIAGSGNSAGSSYGIDGYNGSALELSWEAA